MSNGRSTIIIAHSKTRGENEWAKELTSLIFIYNPKASNYRRAQRWFSDITDLTGLQPITYNMIDDLEQFTKTLSMLGTADHCLIAIGGGDGTVSFVVNLLIQKQPDTNAAKMYVLPLWGGNANDFSYMLNGLSSRNSPEALLGASHPVEIPLIKVTTKVPSAGPEVRYACCYVSFGATAYATTYLARNRNDAKQSTRGFLPLQLLREISAVVRGLSAAPNHSLTSQQGQHSLYEHMLINGPRMGKVNRVPVRLNEPVFFRAAIERKSLKAILQTFIMALLNRPSERWSKQSYLNFRVHDTTEAQIDGESLQLEAGTQVEAKVHMTHLLFITKRLKAIPSR